MMKIYRKWINIFICTLLAGFILFGGIIVFVDPFFQYHRPLNDFPYVIDNQNAQEPGMARNMKYDSVILGSSVTANFNSVWFDEDFSCDSIKLTQNGATVRDIYNIFTQIDRKEDREHIKNVFWTIEPAGMYGYAETAYPLQKYLYDKNPFNDGKYLVNGEVFIEYILKPLFEQNPTDIKDVFETHSVLWYGREYALQFIDREDAGENLNKDEYLNDVEATFNMNVVPILESHPETQFYISFAPYSILRWYHFKQSGELDAVIENYKYVIERLSEYENVKMFFFADEKDIITNMDYYADAIHYSPEVCHFMETEMAKGTHVVSGDNAESLLMYFKDYLMNYDYDSEFE